jgi:hypothetical protein
MPRSNGRSGLEHMLNDPRTSPFTPEGAKAFRAVMDAAQMPVGEVFKHIGKSKKAPRGPTDKEKSEARIEKLEKETENTK